MTRDPRARLFVAVDPPEAVCERLAGWTRSALKGTAWQKSTRVLGAELLHLTLCFLGSRPVAEVELLAEALSSCEVGVGELSLGAPLWLPTRRPRALAVEVHDDAGTLAKLQETVVKAMGEVSNLDDGNDVTHHGGRHPRRFRPHVTVARMSGRSSLGGRELSATPSLSFVPRELILYLSWLSSDGASYEAIASRVIVPPEHAFEEWGRAGIPSTSRPPNPPSI